MGINYSHFNNPHYMIILSTACMAECKYCFGPHIGKIAEIQSVEKIIEFLDKVVKETNQQKVNITFHGGEPLMAPIELWEHALINLTKRFKDKNLRLSLQSNLWNLTNDFCKLFIKYNVAIGTSLDGTKEINDRQRGKGYFDKTYEGIKLAGKYGIDVGCISTFTPESVKNWKEVMNFFIKEKISFSTHPSLMPLNYNGYNNNLLWGM